MKFVEIKSPGAVSQQLLNLLPTRRGHFRYESGHHGDLWLDLDRLFSRPAELRPIVCELTKFLSTYGMEAVCGALVAQMIAAELGTEFYFTEQNASSDASGANYVLPNSLRQMIQGKSVAIVDDAINAGSATGGTIDAVRSAGAEPVVVGALVAVGDAPKNVFAAQKMPFEYIASLSSERWPPADCPLCAAGVPLRKAV